MSAQNVTPELKQWIIDQAKAGRPPDDVLKSMMASGWDEDVALSALEDTLSGFLKEHAKANGLPEPVRVPEPSILDAPNSLLVDGHEIKIVMTLRNPRVIVFGNLLSHDECDQMVDLARARLARSETVVTATGSSEVNTARTSDGMFFGRGENALCARIEARIGALLGWPVENGEGLQVLRYRPGAEYKPHYDYFDPTQPGTPTILKRGGQRVGTVVMYLNEPERGGATTFPDVNLEVAPVKGNAVFFSYDRPHSMTRTLHGGAPVLAGEKWVATKWLREGRFD
ncbi:MAG TPA: 2OG-Fe(II) oxygenase [Rhizobacter sp.]|nr:2OG-Fe(II) oxygenase [Rhizobacter sp.]